LWDRGEISRPLRLRHECQRRGVQSLVIHWLICGLQTPEIVHDVPDKAESDCASLRVERTSVVNATEPAMDCEFSTYRYKDRSYVPFPLCPNSNQSLVIVIVFNSLASVPVRYRVLRVCPYPRHQTIGQVNTVKTRTKATRVIVSSSTSRVGGRGHLVTQMWGDNDDNENSEEEY